MNEEKILWETTPSQWLNIWHFAGAGALAAGTVVGAVFFPPVWGLLLPIAGWSLWRWLVVRSHRYRLSTERLRVTTGVLNQEIDEIELYRVKDITMKRSFWMRLTGLSSIHLKTSDRTLTQLEIPAVPKGEELREQLRQQVEKVRDHKRVREMDFADTSDGSDFEDGDMDLGG